MPASLTHVCMWSKNGWQRITAEEAARIHPGGTVSADSGLFMCDLCGQYVTFTDGLINTRYFKHSKSEKSKDCPERTFGAGYSVFYQPGEHFLPIRITAISSTSFQFELGLIRAPIDSLRNDFRILIHPKGFSGESYVYTKERLFSDRITYLSIGNRPHENYCLDFQNGNDKIRAFWPSSVKGIDPDGTLFEVKSGKMLPYDADVVLGKEYYLLKRGRINHSAYEGIQIQEVSRQVFSFNTWNLYKVSANNLSEDAARFFLDYHCRLTDQPVRLCPVWPLHTEDSYLIKHNQKHLFMLVEGNTAAVNAFPTASVDLISYSPKLYDISCVERQQLISAGRSHVLQYLYFWKEPLNQQSEVPTVSVTDISGVDLVGGETDILPKNKILRVKSVYDGRIVICRDNHIIEERQLNADRTTELDNLTFGLTIQVLIGFDCVWQIEYKRQINSHAADGTALLKQLTVFSGRGIPVPHSLRNIMLGLQQYPQICQWIQTCIQQGVIDELAYRRLQNIYRERNR